MTLSSKSEPGAVLVQQTDVIATRLHRDNTVGDRDS